MSNLLEGGGIYRRDIEEPPYDSRQEFFELPERDIRAIVIDGETYVNAKDVCYVLTRISKFGLYATLSVRFFVKNFINNLIGTEEE